MRDSERRVVERLVGLHSALAGAQITAPAADPPDAVLVLAGGRLGLELTDIFSVGATNERGSLFLQFERQWRELKAKVLDTMTHRHANLDQCDIYLKLDRHSKNELDPANLPKAREFDRFSHELLSAILSGKPRPFNHHSDDATYVEIPEDANFATLRKYARRVEVVWRPEFTHLNVAVDVHLPAVEAGFLSTDTASLERAILRKTGLTDEQKKRISDANVDELYLVLGGQQTGMLPHLQALTREGLQGALVFVRHPYEQSAFDGLVLFDDFNNRAEVFCTKCLSAVQKYNRLGVGILDFYNADMFVMPHACPRLAPKQAPSAPPSQ